MLMNKNILAGLVDGLCFIGLGGVFGLRLWVYLLPDKGRTIREFIFGVLVIPSLFGILWFTVFGNTAVWLNDGIAVSKFGEFISSQKFYYLNF